jgi:hypothetical protein
MTRQAKRLKAAVNRFQLYLVAAIFKKPHHVYDSYPGEGQSIYAIA